ncbi:hypothetical protein RI129_011627 [Pyrocoelia pectoralis]|uniref:Acid phosphatase n=1 Tax=Pyrocoelia pectoralis TaxID=417401 RepID=A0AAN7UWT9_9COLE
MNLVIIILTCIISIGNLKSIENGTLRSVLIVFRHGARTPLWIYKNDPHKYWSEGLGKLTTEGKNQMYSLGKKLRNEYWHFLSQHYNEDEVYVRSSDIVRCKMSAQLALAGLFPPIGYQIWNPNLLWQPIPVSYVPYFEDNLLSMHKLCTAFFGGVKSVIFSEEIQNYSIIHQELFKYLSLHTGEDINDVFRIHSLYDTLKIEEHQNLELPSWSKNLQWDVMYEMAALKLFLFSMTPFTQRLSGGVFLKDVIMQFSKRNSNETNLKLILYSAHDSTLVSVLQTLGFRKLFIPDYGAHLAFELHEVDDTYEIKTLFAKNFNSSLTPLELSFCQSPCTLNEFEAQLQSKSLLPADWDRECLKVNSSDTFGIEKLLK